MKTFIALATQVDRLARFDADSKKDLTELLRMLDVGAHADSYSAERRHLAQWFQVAKDALNKALDHVSAGQDPYEELLKVRKKELNTGIEGNLLRRVLLRLHPEESEPKVSPPAHARDYYRNLRWLWKNKGASLNDWEQGFVRDIGQRLAGNKSLSEKQIAAIEKLLAKYQVPFDATASEPVPDPIFFARFKLGDVVKVDIQGGLFAKILGITFIPGKVLYCLACYTGQIEKELACQYGHTNSIGWDDQGLEYVRMDNVDSIYVVAKASRITCRCISIRWPNCDTPECPRKTSQFMIEKSCA